MLKIKPFSALRYNSDSISDMAEVIAPPYDIISPAEQDELYQKNPFNVIRLELGKEYADDTPAKNRYTRTKAELDTWKSKKVLIREDKPAFYLYEHRYDLDGQTHTLTGLVAAVELRDFSEGVVLPHENVLKGPVTDRFELLKACSTNFSQVFTLYDDPKNQLDTLLADYTNQTPLYDTILPSERYRVWKIQEAPIVHQIEAFFADKVLFIADGHHRYTTGVAYKEYCHATYGPLPADSQANYGMIFLTNLYHPALHLFPTHRVCFGLPNFDQAVFLEAVKAYFDVQSFTDKSACTDYVNSAGTEKKIFGVIFKHNTYVALTLKGFDVIASFFPGTASSALKNLDVSILHSVILQGILNLTPDSIQKQENLRYIKDAEDVFSSLGSGDYDIGFLMNPTRIEEMRDVSLASEKMPQKSTYFYPKLISGLLMNEIDPKQSI